MINSINSTDSAMSMMTSRSPQRPPPPPEKDVFQLSDTNSDGVVSSGTELDTLVEAIGETTGTVIDSETVLSTYAQDTYKGLSGEEVLEMLNSYGVTPSQATAGEGGNSSAMQPPPPVSAEQAISAYTQNSGDDKVGQLLELLQNSNVTVGIDVTS